MFRTLRGPAVVALIALALAACASAPRSDSAALAKSGLTATGTLASEVNDLSTRLRQADVQDAFARTWDLCEANAQQCAPKLPSENVMAARQKLAATIGARGRAVAALGSAYDALAAEAAYDARSDASNAVQGAFKSAQAYASLAGAGTIPAVVGDLASAGLGLWADQAQGKRLRQDNLTLANAVNTLHAGLAKEEETFDSLAQAIVDQEVEAQRYLVKSGVASAGQALQPLADSVGATLVKDPDAVLAKSASARTATQAAILASAKGKIAGLRARYAASLAALDELKRQHLEASKDKPLDLNGLDQRLAELDGLLTKIEAH